MLEEEPSYAALQREVQRKLGRCLLQIQQYELQLKAMVSKRDITAVLGRTSIQRVSTDQATDTKTMGQLVGELTGKYFQPTLLEAGQEQSETDTNSDTDSDDDGHPAGSVRVSMGVSMRPDAHAKLTAELKSWWIYATTLCIISLKGMT